MFKLDVADVLVPVSATVTGNKSLLMMLRTGWIPGHSLGKRRGLLKPITLNTKNDNTGLGYLKYDVCNRLVELLILKSNKDIIIPEILKSNNIFEDKEDIELIREARSEINIKLLNINTEALLDTGSDITCISETLFLQLKHYKLPIMPVKAVQVRGALGQKSAKIQQMVIIPTTLGRLTLDIGYLIVPHLSKMVILGFDWIKNNDIVFDLRKNHMKLKIINNNVEYIIPVGNQDQRSINILEIENKSRSSLMERVKLGSEITGKVKQKLFNVLYSHKTIFTEKLGRCNCYEHEIKMLNDKPIVKRAYPVPYAYREKIGKKLEELENLNIISRASTPYSSPLTFTLKRDGSIRVLLDAREINKYMIAETEKPPLQLDVLNSFHGCNFITTVDLNNAYFQIPISNTSKKYTGFCFNGKSFVYNVLPQGLKTSVGSFSRAMDRILGPEVRDFCVNYLDDLAIITTGTLEDHLHHINVVLTKLENANLTCNIEKCVFLCKEVKMLGFIISTSGIRTDPDKVEAIQKFPTPKTIKHLRAFLGLCNFYRRFIPNYNQCMTPLYELLKKGKRWQWSEKEQSAFNTIKNLFIDTIELQHPDFKIPYYLQTDASGVGYAGVLYQLGNGNEMRVLGYHSKALKGAELNWTVTEQEFFAVISSLKKFETYLRGSKVIIRTDHKALLFVKTWKLYNSRVTRWLLYLEQFDYKIEYITGKSNVVPDILSRYPSNGYKVQEDKNKLPEILYIGKENKSLMQKLKELPQLQKDDKEIQSILKGENLRYQKRIVIENNIVYYKTEERLVVYLPAIIKEDIVNQIHIEMGHQGAYKIIKYIRDRMFFQHLTRDVKNIIKKCHICQLSKSNNIKYVGPCQSIITNNVGEMVMADLYGPLPSSKFGYTYIFVIQDAFSKFVKFYPLRRASGQTCFTKIKHFNDLIGIKCLMTDNGSQFISKIFNKGLTDLKIKLVHTTVRNPRPNSTERVNREIGRLFRAYCSNNHKSWAVLLPDIEKLYNNTYHDSTGYTPWEILYGLQTKLSCDKYLSKLESSKDIEAIRNKVRENLKKTSSKRQNQYNKRHKLIQYNIGDWVKIRKYNRSHSYNKCISKFDLLYDGPYVIAAIPFQNVYTLMNPKTYVIKGNFNTIHLYKYYK